MAQVEFSKPVEDSVPKVDNAVAVGEDLEFQEKWWRFERGVWLFFLLVLVADVGGAFGRGPLSKAEGKTSDGTVDVKYERVQRSTTPSIMTIKLGPGAIRDGRVMLYVSRTVVEAMGAQRVVPQPATSAVGDDGISYTFAATELPATVSIAFEPSFIGVHRFKVGLAGGELVEGRVLVLP